MSVIVIGFLFIGSLFSKRKERKEMSNLISNMIKAVGWTILLTAYVWYPMLQQVLHQKINRPFRTKLQERALNISDSLIGAVNNDLVTFTMGTIGVVSFILPLFFKKKFANKEKIINFCAVTTWFLSTNLFPWEFLQKNTYSNHSVSLENLGFSSAFWFIDLNYSVFKVENKQQKKYV